MISIDLRFIHYLGAKVRLFGDKRLFTSYHNMFKISENNRIWFSISLIGLLAFSYTLLQNLLQVISRTHSQLLILARWVVMFDSDLLSSVQISLSFLFCRIR